MRRRSRPGADSTRGQPVQVRHCPDLRSLSVLLASTQSKASGCFPPCPPPPLARKKVFFFFRVFETPSHRHTEACICKEFLEELSNSFDVCVCVLDRSKNGSITTIEPHYHVVLRRGGVGSGGIRGCSPRLPVPR